VKPLAPGGTIGVAAPASPYDSRSEVLRGVEWWESQGYKVKLAPHLYDRDDYVAGDAEDRAADLNALFADPEVDVVQALQGGYGSAQTIPYLDFDTIAVNPKPLVGFSDITALHVAVRQRAGFPTVYGNGLVGVGDPVRLGGDADLMDVDAYLSGLTLLPVLQRDILAHAVNERLDEKSS